MTRDELFQQLRPEQHEDRWIDPIGASTEEAPHNVVAWLLEAPNDHPWWSQYVVALVDLEPDAKVPARLDEPGMTHELFVYALDPEFYYEDAAAYRACDRVTFLTPTNYRWQGRGSDEQMVQFAHWIARGLLRRLLPAEPQNESDVRTFQRVCYATFEHIVTGGIHVPRSEA